MNGNALLYYKSAQTLLLPVKPRPELDGFELILNKHHYFFCGAEPPINLSSSARVGQHKYWANRFLEDAEIPVPKALLLEHDEFKDNSYRGRIRSLQFPLVIKPSDESQGNGVLCNIKTSEELHTALEKAFSVYKYLIVEEFHANLLSYRVLIFNQEILGVILRHPAAVIGDGTHTLAQLVELANKERKKINEFLGPIALDEEALICLKEQGISIDYLPRVAEKIALGYTSNASRGGTYETLSKKISKENRKLLIRAANVLNLKLVGFDVQCADINIPFKNSNGVIIEANQIPSVRIHEIPMYGRPDRVTRKIMRSFIYRHPIAYFCSLYFNRRTAFYVRSCLVAIIIAIVYPLLSAKGII